MTRRLEVCIDSADGIEACVTGGAHRIELCSALTLGGLTPSAGLMTQASACPIPVRAMIRPRPGGFRFSRADMTQMLADIDAARAAGLEGVVLGAAGADSTLDVDALRILSERAEGMGRTLHRVVDLLPRPHETVEAAVALGFDCILSSGGAPAAAEGLPTLARMVKAAGGRLEIMPGAGITSDNAARILSESGARWLHGSCSRPAPVDPVHRRLGFTSAGERATDPQRIRDLLDAMASVERSSE